MWLCIICEGGWLARLLLQTICDFICKDLHVCPKQTILGGLLDGSIICWKGFQKWLYFPKDNIFLCKSIPSKMISNFHFQELFVLISVQLGGWVQHMFWWVLDLFAQRKNCRNFSILDSWDALCHLHKENSKHMCSIAIHPSDAKMIFPCQQGSSPPSSGSSHS